MAAVRKLCQALRLARWPCSRWTAVLQTLVTAVALGGMLLLSSLVAHAVQPDPGPGAASQVDAYQVTLSVGAGIQYELREGGSLGLPINVFVTGGMKLAAATVLVQYDPHEMRPVSCVRQPDAPDGYCNIGWDTAKGLVRFSILSSDGLALDTDVPLFMLTFEPAPTATKNLVSSVTPRLESIADEHGNYMTTWMQGSTARFVLSTVVGTAVYVGGVNSDNPIDITRGTTVTVPVEAVVATTETELGLGSATFALSFDPTVVRPLECQPVEAVGGDDRSGTCALHSDHVTANLMSADGISGSVTAFNVVFTTAPRAISGAESPLKLTLGAFADTGYNPITVRIFNNSIKVDKTASAIVPVLWMTPADQYLLDDQRVGVQVMLDTKGQHLAAGSWGIRYDPTIVEAEDCEFSPGAVNRFCNATGQAGLVRMTLLTSPEDAPFPSTIGTITFRRHPQAKSMQKTVLAYEVTNFADAAGEQLAYQTQSANITIADTLGSGPAVAMRLLGEPIDRLYQLPQGDSLDFLIDFQIDPARPISNLSGSIHYDPKVLRPTQCLRYDGGNGPAGYCNTEYDKQNGIIRFTLLSAEGISGTLTPFVFTVEATSTSKAGDRSPLHFTIEAISGRTGTGDFVPRTWSAQDETVSIKAPIVAPRVRVGPPQPPAVLTTSIYTVSLGFTQTVPVWVDVPELVPDLNLGAATVEVRYDWDVARATRCTLRSDLTPELNGGFCSLLPGVVRAAFVAATGIDGNAHVFDIEFAQAPNVVGGETTPLTVVVSNFVDTQEAPIPTSIWSGRLDIACYAQPVHDLYIARDGDNLQLTWSHVGSTASNYQVWRAEANAYFAFGDTYSAAIATTVPAPTDGTSPLYTDVGTFDATTSTGIGAWADDLNHYYMVRSMCAMDQGSLQSNRVGKFTRTIGLGMNMLSLPLVSLPQLPYSYRVQDVIGAQLTGADSELYADRAWVWDTARQAYSYGWLIAGVGPEYDGKWWDSASWRESTMMLPANTGFWVQSRHDFPQTIKMLGNVAEPNTQGLEVVENMQLIGSAYPDPVVLSLDAATFSQDGAHGADSELYADRIWYWDESRQQYEFGWLIAGVGPAYDGRWWDSFTWSESQLTLQPGVGYWYQRRGDGTFTWSNPGPMQ